MKAVVWEGVHQVKVRQVKPPQLEGAADALVQITRTSICGTDLHAYRGHIPNFPIGTIMGHEFTGVVREIGDQVNHLKVGDRVVVSDIIACGKCVNCLCGEHYHCFSASLFGYGDIVGTYTPGAQAELVRVPFADHIAFPIPSGISDEQALFVGDILATGYAGVERASIQPKDKVAVIGGGPVGIMAGLCAQLAGAGSVYIIDPHPGRQDMARSLGMNALSPEEAETIVDETGGGVNAAIEAVGHDDAIGLAMDVVRIKGTIVCLGAHHSQAMPFNSKNAFAKELSLHFVIGDPLKYASVLFAFIQSGRLKPESIITHRFSLSRAEEAYRMFEAKEVFKAVLIP